MLAARSNSALEHDAIKLESHRALISLILGHDLVRKVCNFSGSSSNAPFVCVG
jgi:hypothetical protein